MDTAGQCGRQGSRHAVLLDARCRKSSWHLFAVELADISEGGCCIVGSSVEFAPGERIALRMAHLKAVDAEVRWIRGSRVGVAFLAPLNAGLIEELGCAYGIPVTTRQGFSARGE